VSTRLICLSRAWPSAHHACHAHERRPDEDGRLEAARRVETGEDVEIARDGVRVARPVRIDPEPGPAARFAAARGSLAGLISIADECELTDYDVPMIDAAA
jgi:antitoxin (DNA-binding transcriptional repressor) of toxin-antitoxin stability system